jgi:hypothetical protein
VVAGLMLRNFSVLPEVFNSLNRMVSKEHPKFFCITVTSRICKSKHDRKKRKKSKRKGDLQGSGNRL